MIRHAWILLSAGLTALALTAAPAHAARHHRHHFTPYCTQTSQIASCTGRVSDIVVNTGDVSFTLQVPASQLEQLNCSAGAVPVNFRLPRNQSNYNRMYETVMEAARSRRPLYVQVTGGRYDCQADAVRIDY